MKKPSPREGKSFVQDHTAQGSRDKTHAQACLISKSVPLTSTPTLSVDLRLNAGETLSKQSSWVSSSAWKAPCGSGQRLRLRTRNGHF